MEIIHSLSPKYTGVFIFLHGATRNGSFQKKMFLDYLGDKASFEQIKVIFPTSQEVFYTQRGLITNVWFDLSEQNGNWEVNRDQLKFSTDTLSNIIKEEVKNGIPLNRIVIGGISLGGMMASHLAYEIFPEVAGCLLVSSAIVFKDIYKTIRSRTRNPPVYWYHGTADTVIPIDYGRNGFRQMKEAGVSAEFFEYAGAEHELNPEEINKIYEHVKMLIP